LSLEELLSRIEFDPSTNSIKGLCLFRTLLRKETSGETLRFLERAVQTLYGKRRSGIAFVLAEHYLGTGAIEPLKAFYSGADAEGQKSILNALWGEPHASPAMGSFVVKLAIQAAEHTSAEVRAEACSVIQNQAGWGVDVANALTVLRSLLEDEDEVVKQSAAYAVGNAAKRKYNVAECVKPLRALLTHEKVWVRNAGAWALRNPAQSKHDIEAAVPELVRLLSDEDDWSEPRRNAASALLYAKRSRVNAARLKAAVSRAEVNESCKSMNRFLAALARLN
jgi:hypothetical protein